MQAIPIRVITKYSDNAVGERERSLNLLRDPERAVAFRMNRARDDLAAAALLAACRFFVKLAICAVLFWIRRRIDVLCVLPHLDFLLGQTGRIRARKAAVVRGRLTGGIARGIAGAGLIASSTAASGNDHGCYDARRSENGQPLKKFAS